MAGSNTPAFLFGVTMADFPSIQKPSSRTRSVSKPQLKSEFEGNYTQIRSKGTRAKSKWTLSWENLPISDWELLKTHFTENSGSSFTIDKDMIFESADKTVIYSIDEVTAKSSNIVGFYSVEIQIEEQ